MIKHSIYLLLAIGLTGVSFAQQVQTITIANADIYDTFIKGKNSGTTSSPDYNNSFSKENKGSLEELRVGTGTDGGKPTKFRTLIKFNMPSIPTDAIIESATITLIGKNSPQGDNGLSMYRVTGAWSENTVYWYPTPPATDALSLKTYSSTSASDEVLVLDIKDYVEYWRNASSSANQGIMLQMTAESGSKARDFGSMESSNKKPVVVIQYRVVPTITTYPHGESFESSSSWYNTGERNWLTHIGSTNTSLTGPTWASEGYQYVYTEASGSNNKEFLLNSSKYNLSGSEKRFSFDYHMYGADMGSLTLQYSQNGGGWTQLWTLSGDQGNQWTRAHVSLAGLSGTVQFRFRGVTGNGNLSDMAIDNIVIGVPIAAPTGTSVTREGPGVVTLTINGVPGATGYVWYDGNGNPLQDSNSTSFTTPNLTETTTYHVASKNSEGESLQRLAIQGIVAPCGSIIQNIGTLSVNYTGEICPWVEIEFTYNKTVGINTQFTSLEGTVDDINWTNYGPITNKLKAVVRPGEKFRVKYLDSCPEVYSPEYSFTFKDGCNFPSSMNKNFVRTEVPKVPIANETELSEASAADKAMSYAYQDGLGRPTQSVAVGAGIGFRDVYNFHVYEPNGREERQYMPLMLEENVNGAYLDSITAKTEEFYKTELGETHPFSQTFFENPSSSKVLSTLGTGKEWHDNDKRQYFNYYWNTANDSILQWKIVDGANDKLDKPETDGTYAANTVRFAESINEEGMTVRSATDLRGRKIASQIKYNNQWVTTYTVYDDFNRVRYVIPPLAAEIAKTNQLNEVQIDGFLFQSCYDEYGRVIMSKAPGAGWNFKVFDKWDRLVLTQDANQRQKGNYWSFVKYDDWNREILTGEYTTSRTHEQLIGDAKAASVRYETTAGTSLGYTFDLTFPNITEGKILTAHYYDNYDFLTLPDWDAEGNDFSYQSNVAGVQLPQVNDTTILGEATGSKVRVLATHANDHSDGIWLNTVLYLDDKGRIIQTVGENHLGGIDRISNELDWQGQLLKMKVEHTSAYDELTVTTQNVLDAQGNLLETWQQLDNDPAVLVAQFAYNKFGELVEKNLHSTDGGITFLQSIDYSYTSRGWLDQINDADLVGDGTDDVAVADDLFGAKYHYTTPVNVNGQAINGRYDGSLVGFQYQAKKSETEVGLSNTVAYTYDEQNRLIATETVNNAYDMTATYDDHGNIQTLSRKADGTTIDDMVYNYDDNSNKLLDVSEGQDNQRGFTKKTSGGTTMTGLEFEYDDAGNQKANQNKKIMVIGYNKFQRIDYIEFEDMTRIENLYDASGNKLAKLVKDADDNVIGRVDYIGAIEYTGFQPDGGALETEINQVLTDEGRAYKQNGEFFYEYFIRDHQMNNRLAFGILPYRKAFLATMETERATLETQDFAIDPNVRVNTENHTPLGNESAALNPMAGSMVGPAIALPIKEGDYLTIEAWAKYSDNNWNANTANGLFGALSGLLGLSPVGANSETIYANLGEVIGAGSTAGMFSENASTTEPDAYLQYIFFDADSVFQQAGFVGVSMAAYNSWERLEIDGGFTAEMDGFIYIYVANETNADQYVYFDDLKVVHESATANLKVSQINDFYPFGMPTGNSWRNEAYIDPGLLYQSAYAHYDSLTGYYDFLSRSYDPALGRFFAMDPAGQFSSPYMAMGNVPMSAVDEDGEFAFILIGAVVGGVMNAATSDAKGSLFDKFITGAIIGAASAALTAGAMSASSGLTFAEAAGKGALKGLFSGASNWANVTQKLATNVNLVERMISTGVGAGLNNAMSTWSGDNFFNNQWNKDLDQIGISALRGVGIGMVSEGISTGFESIGRNTKSGDFKLFAKTSDPRIQGMTPLGKGWRYISSGSLSVGFENSLEKGSFKYFGEGMAIGAIGSSINVGLIYSTHFLPRRGENANELRRNILSGKTRPTRPFRFTQWHYIAYRALNEMPKDLDSYRKLIDKIKEIDID